jgi:hypothetical protein
MPFSRGGTLFEDHTHPSGLILPADLDPALYARITTLESTATSLGSRTTALEARTADLDMLLNPPTAVVWNATAGAAIADNTLTAMTFADNLRLTGGMLHTLGSAIVTVPRAGLYDMSGFVLWPSNATGVRELFFRISGSLWKEDQVPAAIASAMGHGITDTSVPLVANDTVELVVRHTAGGPLTLAATNDAPSLSVRWVGTGL